MPTDVSLDDLLQDLSEQTRHRLVLLDTTLHVVAYSIHETDRDRIRLGQILAHSDSWPRPAIPARGYATLTLPHLGGTAFLAVTDGERPMGYLMVALGAGGRLPAAARRRLLAATTELGVHLTAREQGRENRRTRTAELVAQLLGPQPRRRAKAAGSLVAEGLIGSSAHYSAVAVGKDPATLAEHEANTRGVSLIIDFVTHVSTASVAGGALDGVGVLIFPRPVVIERLTRLLEEVPGLCAGIGPLVPSLDEIPESFVRARAAWRAAYRGADRQPPVLHWQDAGIDGIFAMLPLESLTVADLPAPVRRLWEGGPDPVLIDTLEAYLACGGDARATARRLNIHRSTFYYRFDRLRTALRVELADGEVRRELHAGLRLARLARL